MKYRTFGKLDWKPSALGFGAMRLPTAEGTALSPNITESEAVKMMHYAIDQGVNFFDTAYFYHQGQSERAVGKAMAGGWRDKVKIATKSPVMVIDSADKYDKMLDEQLERLGVEMIDFYLFHSLNEKNWNTVKNFDLIAKAEAAQKAGKIGHICFSFHDKYELFEEIVNAYDKWTYCQIQYNFMDTEIQAGTKGLKLAASKGIGVVAMEPLKGGKLTNPIPEAVEILQKKGIERSLTEVALDWLWAHPEVSVVLSGMSEMKQVEENIKFALGEYSVSEAELQAIAEIKSHYESRKSIQCTNCTYCMPCPQDINIPNTLNLYNEKVIYDYSVESQRMYNALGKPAAKCVGCGECEKKCPQMLPISEWMTKIDDLFAVR